ncbi:MAG: prephenate dehydratase domain-containing protein, partial [Butyrivibrio sp.]|nr:prephenate dehydratase domain-containing protein [Butyrivibrio sp.]
MNLDELRIEIDKLDKTILSSFEKRMELCHQVADYKKANGLPVFQADREKAIIEKVRASSPEGLKDASAVLFTEIMDISKSLQQSDIYRSTETASPSPFTVLKDQLIGCQGTAGSNSETAAHKLFKDNKISFYNDFEQVFKAVSNGEITYGILPIHNSTAGSVTQTYDLIRKYDVYITKLIRTEIHHCLAVRPGNSIQDIQNVYSHPQALSQCSAFLHENGLRPIEALNTATAAKFVSKTDEKCGAICSESAAELYGLEILQKNISNVVPNYTQFICISRQFLVSDDADT